MPVLVVFAIAADHDLEPGLFVGGIGPGQLQDLALKDTLTSITSASCHRLSEQTPGLGSRPSDRTFD